MLRDPADWEQRERVVIQRKYRLFMLEVELHARADDRCAEHRQHEEKSVEPPALARRWDDPDTWLGLRFPFEGGRKRGCGFGHSEVRGQSYIAEVWFTSAI